MQAGINRMKNGSTAGPSPFNSGPITTPPIRGTGNGARSRPFQLKCIVSSPLSGVVVMAGLDPAIHVFSTRKRKEEVDHPDKPGDDELAKLLFRRVLNRK